LTAQQAAAGDPQKRRDFHILFPLGAPLLRSPEPKRLACMLPHQSTNKYEHKQI
jgi:hypothetical protein